MISGDLFAASDLPSCLQIKPDVFLLQGFAAAQAEILLTHIRQIAAQSPFRNMQTPGGFYMSAAITNCGEFGWLSDQHGYRYSAIDPQSQQAWPPMPQCFCHLAEHAARLAGFAQFRPDVCLINRYETGAKMGLHQDKDELDFSQPIVSVSLGRSALFQFGGEKRTDPRQSIPLAHGDVIVWGGTARRHYHGVVKLTSADHPLTGDYRFNLTFRRAR